MKPKIIIVALLFFCASGYSQNTIIGTFPGLAGQKITLLGYNGFDTYTIDSVFSNEKGIFNLSYGKKDYGMGDLRAEDGKPFFVILSGETINLTGDAFALPETIEIVEGQENRMFEQYALEHPRREQALSAWEYLEKIYTLDTLFARQDISKQAIVKEKQRIKNEDSLFLANLPRNSYVSWYLPVRKLISSVSTIAQYRTEEIPVAIAAFREMDYTDLGLYKSGLYRDVLESHYWLIENSGHTLDSVYMEMNISIDRLIDNLKMDEQKLNEITEYLFKFLEKRSLFKASEYLALKLLNEKACIINDDLTDQLEFYRAMKIGNTAPDFVFLTDCLAPGYPASGAPKKLSDLKTNYTVVVFGASWCPQCPVELSNIARVYDKWKQNGLEVVFVSLDEDTELFKRFANVFPFISICDYQKWESPIVKAYHVFATPTIYLLNDRREIVLRPNSASQLDSWVEWFLVQGNK